jgi:hypothetical protein
MMDSSERRAMPIAGLFRPFRALVQLIGVIINQLNRNFPFRVYPNYMIVLLYKT